MGRGRCLMGGKAACLSQGPWDGQASQGPHGEHGPEGTRAHHGNVCNMHSSLSPIVHLPCPGAVSGRSCQCKKAAVQLAHLSACRHHPLQLPGCLYWQKGRLCPDPAQHLLRQSAWQCPPQSIIQIIHKAATQTHENQLARVQVRTVIIAT
jgi:hypothetical protein